MEGYVPIIEITDENFESMWPAISNAITESSFIALDCELSGLGDRAKLNCSEIDIRYLNTKDIANEYSIVSLGLSCFSCQSCSCLELDENGQSHSVKSHNYLVQTFNILTLCSTKYTVEGGSLKFLLSHGFDFNRQYAHGLSYTRGEDLHCGKERKTLSVKNIFQLIIQSRKPIALHNGFVDLIFLYQSFYADLPTNIETFAADLQEMFASGIYDTKYISEFHQSLSATYLEFVFKYLLLENSEKKKKGGLHCRLNFPPYPTKGIDGLKWCHYFLKTERSSGEITPLCESYKFHGWCSKANDCPKSHNIDRIVRELRRTSGGKKKRRSNYVAASSLAQLINMKKQKMEVENQSKQTESPKLRKRNSSKRVIENSCEPIYNSDNRIARSISGKDIDKEGFVNNSGEGEIRNAVISTDEENETQKLIRHESNEGLNESFHTSASNNCNGTSDDVPKSKIHPSKSNTIHVDDPNSLIVTLEDSTACASDSAQSPVEMSRSLLNPDGYKDCNGHSAGYDAFMTGFIFAYDIASLGSLPSISAFPSSKEMSLHHIVDKVYLIRKEFPFLVRSSLYNGTSSTHDRIIKLLNKS